MDDERGTPILGNLHKFGWLGKATLSAGFSRLCLNTAIHRPLVADLNIETDDEAVQGLGWFFDLVWLGSSWQLACNEA